MAKPRYLIIGAGPTGLGAAFSLFDSGISDWILLEAGSSAGGLAGSAVDEFGFTWDFGGHVSFSANDLFNDVLTDAMGGPEEWILHERRANVSLSGTLVGFPIQQHLEELPAGCVSTVDESQQRHPRPPSDLEEWCIDRFGSSLTDVFFRPYNEKLWCRPLNCLSVKWVDNRVAPTQRPVRGRWGANSSFRYPRVGGNGEPWRRLASQLGQLGTIRYSASGLRIDTHHHEVALVDGSRFSYDHLISTMPIDLLTSILVSDSAQISEMIGGLERTITHLAGIRCSGSPTDTMRDTHWRYFADTETPFYRATVLSNYSRANVPNPSAWSMLVETAGRHTTAPPTEAAILEATLREALLEDRRQAVGLWRRTLDHGYPVPTLDRDSILAEVQSFLEKRDIYSRGRFGGWKYEVSNQDHSFLQGYEVVKRLIDGTEETVYTV